MKNLRIKGITLKPCCEVYTSSVRHLMNPLVIFSALISESSNALFYIKYSKKRVLIPNEHVHYLEDIGKDEIIISEGLAKKLGVTLGDKVSIKGKPFGKIDDNYLEMYEKNPGKFIKYFNEQHYTDKKKILKEIIEQDFVNEKVAAWLDEKYSSLVREVGLE